MMSGQEIAKELGITRQAVSNTLKRAMGKAYTNAKELWSNESREEVSPFEVATNLSVMFNVCEEDMPKFFKLFPLSIRNEIAEDAKKRFKLKTTKE